MTRVTGRRGSGSLGPRDSGTAGQREHSASSRALRCPQGKLREGSGGLRYHNDLKRAYSLIGSRPLLTRLPPTRLRARYLLPSAPAKDLTRDGGWRVHFRPCKSHFGTVSAPSRNNT